MYKILGGDATQLMDELEPHSVDMIFTSPDPLYYYKSKRDLDIVMNKAWRVLKDTGSMWIELGDYHDEDGRMMLLPERFMKEWENSAWLLRSKIIWHRIEASGREEFNRFQRNWEYVLLYTKMKHGYYFKDNDGFLSSTSVFPYAYLPPRQGEFESGFPEDLVDMAIGIGCPRGGTVLDPFCNTATTGVVALRNHVNFIGMEIRSEEIPLINQRLEKIKGY